MMEKDYIYNLLMKRGYDAYSAKLVAEDLLKLSKPLNNYLSSWLNDESYSEDLEINIAVR